MGYIPKTTADVLTGSSINSGGCESSDCEQTVSYKDGYSVFGVRREKSKRRNWQEKFVCATHVKWIRQNAWSCALTLTWTMFSLHTRQSTNGPQTTNQPTNKQTTVIRVAFVAFYVIYLYDSAATFSLPRDHWVQATQSQSAGCTGPLSVVTQDSSCFSGRECSSREAQTGERGRERENERGKWFVERRCSSLDCSVKRRY